MALYKNTNPISPQSGLSIGDLKGGVPAPGAWMRPGSFAAPRWAARLGRRRTAAGAGASQAAGGEGLGARGAEPGAGAGRGAFVRMAAGGRQARRWLRPRYTPAVKTHGEIYDSACKGAEGLSRPVGPGSGYPDSLIVPSAAPRADGRRQRRRPGRRPACLLRGSPLRSALVFVPPLPGKQRSPFAPGPAPGRCRAGNQEAACPICQAFDS